MRDVNSILRTKLYQLLNGSISAIVYNEYVPPTVNDNAYVVISSIDSRDNSGMTNANTTTSFQIAIYTKDTSANPGSVVNIIAGEIFELIYPQPNSVLDLEPELQNVSIDLESDRKPFPLSTTSAVFINRFLTFRLNVFHRN